MQEQAVTGGDGQQINNAFYRILAMLLVLLVAWAAVFYKGLVSAIAIWYGSDIFNHCLFVLPGAFYLIYLKRDALTSQPVKANYWVILFCLPLIALYAVGLAGDVQLFMHAAMFILLPVLYWMILGNRAARQIAFPLFFIVFCIPIGEELVPFLQQIAARFSVVLLELSGIPVFRSGLYIEIPKGRFLVAEACSGISFFIASLVIGCLYSYLNLRSPWRRASFVFLSVIFPVAANIVRVYGIILIAHLSDMKYAVGADHLIYGWFFFAFVIICLIALGEWIREKSPAPDVINTKNIRKPVQSNFRFGLALSAGLLIAAALWFEFIGQALPDKAAISFQFAGVPGKFSMVPDDAHAKLKWQAGFRNVSADRYLRSDSPFGTNLDVYQAFYSAGEGELISSLNRLYDQDNWTRVETYPVASTDHPYSLELVSSPSGQLRLLAHWYVLSDKTFASRRNTKITQIMRTLSGEFAHGAVVIISMDVERRNIDQQQAWFVDQINADYDVLSSQVRVTDE